MHSRGCLCAVCSCSYSCEGVLYVLQLIIEYVHGQLVALFFELPHVS